MKKLFALIAVGVMFAVMPACASLVYDQASFHDATNITSGGPEAEGGEMDNGGTIMVFIRCTGGTENFYNNPKDVDRINGTLLRDIAGYKWARVWPQSINNGETAVLMIKGIQSPIAEGQNLHFEIYSDSNTKLDFWDTMTTPLLRIGNVVPSNDNRALYISVRNTDPTWSYNIGQVFVMGADVTARCTYYGGTNLPVNDTRIIKVQYDDEWQMYEVKPMPIRIFATRADGPAYKLGAFVRWTEPIFPLGTWSGNLFTSEGNLQTVRESFQLNFAGPAYQEETNKLAAKYMVRGMSMPDSEASVLERRYKPGLSGWFVDDEPELSNRSSTSLFDGRVKWAWANDWLHPTMINNARNKQFQQYGMMVDHPCYDHYCQYANLCYGGVGTVYSIKNSFWYAESLKKNCEPKRIWAYSQGVSTTTGWGGQPKQWGIRVQLWNEIMGGVKGIKWFMANDRNSTYAAQYDAIAQETKVLNQIRSLVLYGDVANRINVSNSNMIARLIVGPDACLAIVTNSTGTSKKALLGGYTVTMSDLNNQNISFEVPWSIDIQQVKQVTENGLVVPAYSLNGHNLTFGSLNLTSGSPYRVFLIGKNDTTAPDEPREVNIARWSDGNTAVISWNDAYDNYGIKGYKVYRDGAEIADVRTPLFPYGSAGSFPAAEYTVKAYDAAGNFSNASRPVKQSAPTWTFDDEGNFEGWREAYNIWRPRGASWGAWYFWTQTAANPSLWSPEVRIDANVKKHVRFYFYNATYATQACLYFSQDGTNISGYQWFNLTPQNNWNWVDLDMTGVSGWTGTIKRFRVDMPAGSQQDWQVFYINQIDVY